MTSGIKTIDIKVGTGPLAERTKAVVVHVRGFLNRGDEFWNTYSEGRPTLLDLSKRYQIPGLLKGIEGMRVGGKRELVVSPHLAYGATGIPGQIPPDAVIHFEVELLEVSEVGAPHSELLPAGKQLLVFRPGEQVRNLPQWQFGVREADEAAGGTITLPVAGATWRNPRTKNVELKLKKEQVQALFESVQATFADYPSECLRHEDLWADTSEKANSVTRDSKTNSLCVTVYIYERGSLLLHYGLPETSPVLLDSSFYKTILSFLEPSLATLTSEVKAFNQAEKQSGRLPLP
jgi:hypothetical protein